MQQDPRSFLDVVVDDGRPLITLTGLCLALSGAFALFQSATGHFLPHDIDYLQMAPQELCSINECRIVHFMFHDRVSFGGSLIAHVSPGTPPLSCGSSSALEGTGKAT